MFRSTFFSFFMAFATVTLIFPVNSTAAETSTVVLDVPGMTCQFCPITIRKALEKVPGVIDAKSDYGTKTATVIFDPAQTDIKTLTNATKNAGYVSKLKQKK